MSTPAFHIRQVSDSALLVELGCEPSLESSLIVLSLFESLASRHSNLFELHPAYSSLLIEYDLLCLNSETVRKLVTDAIESTPRILEPRGQVVEIPVDYDQGLDWPNVEQQTSLTRNEIEALHSQAEYHVAFLGFTPGFPYLLGLNSHLICTRKAEPRVRVPAGSVAIAGDQAGIYPGVSSGGWQIIGRTSVPLFNPHSTEPSLLRPGDRVRFRPESNLAAGENQAARKSASDTDAALVIEDAGLELTVQDLGRSGFTHFGVSPGGAADPVALRVGNRLVSNADSAAGLEHSGGRTVVRFLKDGWFAVTGAECEAQLDDHCIRMWTSLPVSAGQRLELGPSSCGQRSYLCIHGGFEVELVLGSRSTFVAGKWGGFGGRSLVPGDRVPSGDQQTGAPGYFRAKAWVGNAYTQSSVELRVTKGAQQEWFTAAAHDIFYSAEFVVTSDLSRTGIRFQGPRLVKKSEWSARELVSEGVPNGAIQVPASGRPVALFCEQRTTGGYAKIANVISADLFRLGQLAPGQTVRFRLVGVEEAVAAARTLETDLQSATQTF